MGRETEPHLQIGALADYLESLGLQPSALDVADLLWLALRRAIDLGRGAQAADDRASHVAAPAPQPPAQPKPEPKSLGESGASAQGMSEAAATTAGAQSVPLHAEQPDIDGDRLPLAVPLPSALPQKLELGRALRPLRRRVPSPQRQELDEEATVQRIVETRLWAPVLRPTTSRWLDLALVVDTAPAMLVWQRTINELQHLLERSGVFRDVRRWQLGTDDPHAIHLAPLGAPPGAASHNPRELADPSGRRLTLVISDGVAPAWQGGAVTQVLRALARGGGVALLQVLPYRLWERSVLGSYPAALIGVARPNAPSAQLPYRLLRRTFRPMRDVTPLPVASLEVEDVQALARLIAGSPGAVTSGVLLPSQVPASTLQDPPPLNTLLTDFRLHASEQAQVLMQALAVAPLSAPVMHLVHHHAVADPRTDHMAEVLLSGLIRRAPRVRAGDSVTYEFVPGARAALQEGLPRGLGLGLLRRISEYIASQDGRPNRFRAMLADPGNANYGAMLADNPEFAAIAASYLERLGGRYADIGRRLARPGASASSPGQLGGIRTGQGALLDSVTLQATGQVGEAIVRGSASPANAIFCPSCDALILEDPQCATCGWERPPSRIAAGTLAWKRNLALDVPRFTFEGAVAGTCYVLPDAGGGIYGVDVASGTLIWRYQLAFGRGEALASDGRSVFIGTVNPRPVITYRGEVVALEGSTGRTQWKFARDVDSFSAPAVADNVVYVSSADHKLHALNASDGTERWRADLPGWGPWSPVVGGGVVVTRAGANHLVAFDTTTGQRQWELTGEKGFGQSFSISGQRVAVRRGDGTLLVIELATGQVRWSTESRQERGFTTPPVIAGDLVLIGDRLDARRRQGYGLRALSLSNGNDRWQHITGQQVVLLPHVVNDTVVVGLERGGLLALGLRDGSPRWSFSTEHSLASILSGDRHLLFTTDRGGNIYGVFRQPATTTPASVEELQQVRDLRGAADALARAGDRAAAAAIYAEQLKDAGHAERLALPQITQSELDAIAGLQELDALIGLASVKAQVRQLTAALLYEKRYSSPGRPPRLRHLIFTGNPGTGMTTVARILGRIFADLGILKQGHLVTVTRNDLVGEYIGHTEPKTRRAIERADGGVLFVDEAHTLASARDGIFGEEALSALLEAAGDPQGRLVMILAGYPDEMRALSERDPGVVSRFATTIAFPDYSLEELSRILVQLVERDNLRITADAQAKAAQYLDIGRQQEGAPFGNAREVRNLYDQILRRYTARIRAIPRGAEHDQAAGELIAQDVPNHPHSRTTAQRMLHQGTRTLPLVLRFQPHGQQLTVEWSTEDGRSHVSTFNPPGWSFNLTRVFQILGRQARSSQALTDNEILLLEQLGLSLFSGATRSHVLQWIGRTLYRALAADPASEKMLALVRDRAAATDRVLSIHLHFSANSIASLALPWELLWDDAGPLLFSGAKTHLLSRHLNQTTQVALPLPRRGSLLILVLKLHLLGNEDTDNKERERYDTARSWSRLIASNLAQVDELSRVTRQKLALSMSERKTPFDIVHFENVVGNRQEDDYLWLDKAEGGIDRINIAQLATLLQGVKLVVLQPISLQAGSEKPSLVRVSAALCDAGIPAVIAFQSVMEGSQVRRFNEVLYKELAGGASLQTAVASARQILYVEEPEGPWYAPFITLRGGDSAPLYFVASSTMM